MAKQIRMALDDLLPHFAELEDPRSEVNHKHPLSSVIVIAMMAVLAGPTGIAHWARFKQDLLTKWLPLPHGIPTKDVFRRVLMSLKPDAFQLCFSCWLQIVANKSTEVDYLILNVDGKTLRRSHNHQQNLGPLAQSRRMRQDAPLKFSFVSHSHRRQADAWKKGAS